MRPHPLALAAALLALVSAAAPAQPVPALRDYRWAKRVLVVFAPPAGAGDSTYAAQRREFARAAEAFAERDLVVLDLAPDADAGRVRTLRRELGVPGHGFAVVLVGKDGGVKLRRRGVLAAERVLSTVDAMPIGAEEARRRRAPNGRADGPARSGPRPPADEVDPEPRQQ